MELHRDQLYQFGSFRLDPTEHNLLRENEIVPLTPKVFEILLMLVEANGHLVTKDEFFERIWPDSIVEEINIAKNISIIRKILAEEPGGVSYIETVPTLGYRFTAPVFEIEAPAKKPSAETVRETKFDLPTLLKTRIILTVVILTGVVTGVGFLFYGNETGERSAEALPIESLAIMPPEIDKTPQDIEYLIVGLYDGLISKVSQFPGLVVKSKSAVSKYKNKEIAPQVIGRELSVRTILKGLVNTEGNDLKISFELIDSGSGNILWNKQYVRNKKDLVVLEREISLSLAEKLRPNLAPAEADRITRSDTEDPAAYEAYMKGRYLGNRRSFEEVGKAEKFYLKALEIDPNYAKAWGGLADYYWWQTQSSEILRDNEAYLRMRLKAEKSLYKALELAPDLAELRTSLAIFKLYDWDFKGAEREFQRAIELNPNYVRARMRYAHFLAYTGNSEKALKELDIGRTLAPVGISNNLLVHVYYLGGRYEEGIEKAREVLELRPQDQATMHFMSMILTEQGKYEEALALEKKAFSLEKEGYNPAFVTQMAVIHARSGNKPQSRRLLRELVADEPKGWTSPFRIAVIYAALEENDKSFEWLEKAFQARESLMTTMKVNPIFKPLHSSKRWPELLRRVGFPE